MYFLLDKSEKMPASCWGKYRRIAIVRMPDNAHEPPRIDERIKGLEIVDQWRSLNVGKTDRCAYRVALREAETKLAELERAQ